MLVLKVESEEEAGFGEDAAALLCYFIPGLLPVSLQQVQQRLHKVFHQIHRLDGLVVLKAEYCLWSRGKEDGEEVQK